MLGDAGDDIFDRQSGDDVGYGGAGADLWVSGIGGGNQRFYGGRDDDRVFINIEGDDFPDNPGPYTVRMSGGFGDDEIRVFNFIGTRTRIFGGPGDDSISHSDADGHDLLRGGRGNDTLRIVSEDPSHHPVTASAFRLKGDRGSDLILGSPQRDFLRGGPGKDTIEGHAGNDVIRGGPGADTLRGNRGADTLRGNRGADTLRGGIGPDMNFGGTGSDLCRSPSRAPRAHSCER
jgi:Ca2+-binding RTX toxin-like protein